MAKAEEEVNPQPKTLEMERSLPQLLYHYLPGRVVDWEDGLAVVQLGEPYLKEVWSLERSRLILDELKTVFRRWKDKGGRIDPDFPDLDRNPELLTVGEPRSIEARPFQALLMCRRCSRLVPVKYNAKESNRYVCPSCKTATLRQFPFVFIHGCGELVPFQEWIPFSRKGEDGKLEQVKRPIRCQKCGPQAPLRVPSRTERLKDLRIVCTICGEALQRVNARCPRCTMEVIREKKASVDSKEGQTIVQRTAMRATRYSANEGYYPQNLSILRLDRPQIVAESSGQLSLLTRMIPPRQDASQAGADRNAILQALINQAKAAKREVDFAEVISAFSSKTPIPLSSSLRQDPCKATLPEDIVKNINESIAFETTVSRQSVMEFLRKAGSEETMLDRHSKTLKALGLKELKLVSDLPIVTATFGFTRRSYEPTYSEPEFGADQLATTLRAFPAITSYGARAAGREDIQGTIPILAREGEHEGIFFSLDPARVCRWLEANGMALTKPEEDFMETLLYGLEDVDRFYDHIWDLPLRRMIFGLIHTISHVLMRAISGLSGLEKTSVQEYIFLPLLGAVVFDSSSSFKLGRIEAAVRRDFDSLLRALSEDALTCLYDVDCIDSKGGACHGCIHSPEICCRFFNHGLSRAFLLGGHAPWAKGDLSERITGFWHQLGPKCD